jgi:hypothetical protein
VGTIGLRAILARDGRCGRRAGGGDGGGVGQARFALAQAGIDVLEEARQRGGGTTISMPPNPRRWAIARRTMIRRMHLDGVAVDSGNEEDVLELLHANVEEQHPDHLVRLGGEHHDQGGIAPRIGPMIGSTR